MRVALAGNPNSGKTTIYNELTGAKEKVGNWAGVTVASREKQLKSTYNKQGITIVDLPGSYSIAPFTSEESITKEFIVEQKPDVIINIVDATNLSRSLFFTTQLLDLKIPMIVALNKFDLAKKKEITIDVEKLSKELGCKVVVTVAEDSHDKGLQEIINSLDTMSNPSTFNQKFNKDKERFDYVTSLLKDVEVRKVSSSKQTLTDKIDKVVANRWLGILIFIGVMYVVFSLSQTYIGPWIADYLVMGIENFQGFVGESLPADVSPILSTLLVNGIIGGVGAVVGFLPLIMVLFFMLALLEDSGYMARVAVVMDRYFKKIGLSGKSIIPMVIGIGCGIPGIMASRTIKDERQRRTTAMLTPFVPCGAKLPVITLFAAVFFGGAAWVSNLMYFLGIIVIMTSAWIILKMNKEQVKETFFVIELPDYKIPSLKRALLSMWERGKAFVVKAGTIILVCNAAVEIMSMFNWQFQIVAEGMEHTSILASISTPFAFLLVPLGFGVWQLAAAAIVGFIAKENVVGTIAVVYSITNFINPDELALVDGMSNQVAETLGITAIGGLAYLIFNLFTPPCFAAIGAMRSEMNNNKWLFGGIGFQFGMGYLLAFVVYQVGTLITTGSLGQGFILGLIISLSFVLTLVYLMRKSKPSHD